MEIILKKKKSTKKNKNSKKTLNNKNNINNNNYYQSSYEVFDLNTHSKNNLKKLIKKNNNQNYENLNDEELNSLEYEIAIEVDKRTYFQYYWSLLKKKQLILFTFFRSNDFNLISIKICLFLLSFSLYFTINGFFFSDETMRKIHESKGYVDFLFQIPQILYSTIASSIINVILKQLSLSEKNLLSLKQENNLNKIVSYSKYIKRCLVIKFICFFILNTLFLLFFWYFISCFCAVYRNTQMILIKDTLISFGLSMLYPFGLNILPGFFRIPALKAQKKDKKCLYKTSSIIALI